MQIINLDINTRNFSRRLERVDFQTPISVKLATRVNLLLAVNFRKLVRIDDFRSNQFYSTSRRFLRYLTKSCRRRGNRFDIDRLRFVQNGHSRANFVILFVRGANFHGTFIYSNRLFKSDSLRTKILFVFPFRRSVSPNRRYFI